MKSIEFTNIVSSTKKIVLSAIQKNLAERFSFAIDDVVQETYLRAFNALKSGKFRGDSELSTYLYTIARNEALRANSIFEREERKIEKLKKEPETAGIFLSFFSVEKILELLGIMPDAYSSVIKRQMMGKSIEEISNELGIARGTVKSRASRGKDFIRKHYFKEPDDEQ